MRERLGRSLDHVLERAGDALPAPPGLPAFRERLAATTVAPQAFGAYYELVLAIEDGELDAASGFLRELADAPAAPGPDPVVRVLDDPERCPLSRRYARLVDTDPRWPLRIRPPDPARAEATRGRIAEALGLLDRFHPELAGEVRALVGEIVLATGDVQQDETFDGVSSFMLWRGLVLHAGSHETTLEMAEALAHESAHSLLFGFAVDGPLLENDDEQRFASPLRRDPRPLDGIYHATFVTARMHHALRVLAEAGALGPAERTALPARLERHAKRFEEGLAVLERHARPTPVGAEALANAAASLRSA